MPQINDIDQYELLFCIDQNILKFIDYKFIKLYNKIKDKIKIVQDKEKDNIIFNTNYIYNT